MSSMTLPLIETTRETTMPGRRPALPLLLGSGVLAYVCPPMARMWPRAKMRTSLVSAGIHAGAALVWAYLFFDLTTLWSNPKLIEDFHGLNLQSLAASSKLFQAEMA